MAKCNFCRQARTSLDTTVQAAHESVDGTLAALDNLKKKMDASKWGRRKTPVADDYTGEDRRGAGSQGRRS